MDKKELKEEQKAPREDLKPVHQQASLSQVEKLMEENLRLTEEIYKMTKKINKFVLWSRVFGILKILIIAVPVIIGIIYLPPILKDVFNQYKNLIGIGQGPNGGVVENADEFNLGGIDFDQLSPELKKLLGR